MSIIIKEMTVKHECEKQPSFAITAEVATFSRELIWSNNGELRSPWRYCAAPLPQDMAAVIKAVS